MNTAKAWSPMPETNQFSRIETLVKKTLDLTARPDFLDLQIYKSILLPAPSAPNARKTAVTLFPSSLIEMPTGTMTLDGAVEALVQLFCTGYELLFEYGIPVSGYADFIMLTSTHDVKRKLNRSMLSLEEQAAAARMGVSWQKVIQLERLNLPLQEWIDSLVLPVDVRRRLYPGIFILG